MNQTLSSQTKPQRQYLVKWLGYGDEHNSWEPEEGVSELNAFKACHNYLLGLPIHEGDWPSPHPGANS
eukprot:104113-Pelagomonas_calceolata.AAC.1